MNAAPETHLLDTASEATAGHYPLAGVKVLDLTQWESGPSCTEALAWLGADVIKVEEPARGEQGRYASSDQPGLDAYYFIMMNANKRSVTCNLKHEGGRELVRSLIGKVDIFVENFGPGVIERLGFDYDSVRKLNPSIIYAQIKGFPAGGPYENFLCFDPVAQAAGGITSITGEPDGRPMKAGPNVADHNAGMHCVIGILAALIHRSTTGKGQRVEVTMQEVVAHLSRSSYGTLAKFGTASPRAGNQSVAGGSSPAEVYRCKGGGPNDYCVIYTSRAGNQHWERILKLIGQEDLAADPRFATPKLRYENREAVDEIVTAWTLQRDKETVMRELGNAGVPAGAVFDTMELSRDPFLRERGTFVAVDHPVRGEVIIPGWPVRMSGIPPINVTAAPLLGAHNEEVYAGILGLSEGEIAALKSQRAI